MRITHTIALAATTLILVVGPSTASAGSLKWMSCQLYDSAKSQVLHLRGAYAMGGTVDTDRQYNNFLEAAKYQEKIDATSKTEGLCIMSNSEDEALRGVAAFVKHYKAQGAKEVEVGFAPH